MDDKKPAPTCPTEHPLHLKFFHHRTQNWNTLLCVTNPYFVGLLLSPPGRHMSVNSGFAMSLDDGKEGAKGLVHAFRSGELLCDLGIQDNHVSALSILPGVLPSNSFREVVLFPNLIIGVWISLLHTLFFLSKSLGGH